MARYELTDAAWSRIENLFPERGGPGRPRNDDRQTFNGIVWVLRTGAPWRDLPARYGAFTSVYTTFSRWRADGTLTRILGQLRADLDERDAINWELWCIDGSSVRASRAASGARKKGGQGTSLQTMLWGVPAEG